jgi:membrane-anchored glycerophosphoryl diester phosphodiesterase (GDPDase)
LSVLQASKKCPFTVAVLSCLLAVAGVLGVVAQPVKFLVDHHFESDMLWAVLVSVAAAVSGVYMLRGIDWARWLAMAWIAFHVVLSFFHSWLEMAIHGVIFVVFAVILFLPDANRFFRSAKS